MASAKGKFFPGSGLNRPFPVVSGRSIEGRGVAVPVVVILGVAVHPRLAIASNSPSAQECGREFMFLSFVSFAAALDPKFDCVGGRSGSRSACSLERTAASFACGVQRLTGQRKPEVKIPAILVVFAGNDLNGQLRAFPAEFELTTPTKLMQ